MSSLPARSEGQLCPEDRQQLTEAHRRLREAVLAYQPYVGRELPPEEPTPARDAKRIAEAQALVEEAEHQLWRLREQLLGWERPSWAPDAALVADWFSEEDAVYDDIASGFTG